MAYEQELHVALDAAQRAGRLILEHYAAFEVIPDAPADISTDTDRASQATILKAIHHAYPADALCAEEATTEFASHPRLGPRQWVVDPIDGTRGFARKNDEFSVMIGLVDNGRVVVGVVLEPALKRLTFASMGGGCWRVDGENPQQRRCQVTKVAELSAATITQSHSRKGKPPSKEIQALRPARVIETYSAGIKLAQVARAEADIYLNTYDACHDWDICAGQLLVEEAGGRVTNLRGDAPRYGLEAAIQDHGLLASNCLLHPPALTALAKDGLPPL